MHAYTNNYKKFNEFGIVEEIYHPVVKIKGLPNASPGEVVVFENNSQGQILLLNENDIEILLFSQTPVAVGMHVARTGNQLSVPVGDYLKGNVIDPLGNQLTSFQSPQAQDQNKSSVSASPPNQAEYRQVDIPPLSIFQRYQITEPLLTGISIVDMLLPLGKGQRELIVGDRKTGKTSFLLSTIKNQINQNSVSIYVAIGKQIIDIELVREWFENQGILDQIIIVAATAQDPQSLVYLAPFTGMTLAEYFRDQGKDVLIVLDDLSTHAKFYREISLLAKRFPGRDSYPGDIFFTHARLLERAGNFTHPSQGTVSISCLPVAETIENDLSDYIVSNLIGITDGHLLFDSTEFVKGRRPAINPTLSVTRVGRQTQGLIHQDASQRLMTFISQYNRSQRFAHFGAELTENIKELLARGKILFDFFNQEPALVIPLNLQLIFVAMIWLKFFENNILPLSPLSKSREEKVPIISVNADSNQSVQNKATIAEYLSRIINGYKQADFKQWVDATIELNDWFKMLDKVKTDKEKILKICGKENSNT